MDEINSLVILVGCGGMMLGFLLGSLHEEHRGKYRKEADKLRNIVMRMIPKLKVHYTDDYILWELIRGEGNADTNETSERGPEAGG